jgi:dihydroxyacetone kinase phosphoprotein-dependent L subunit
VSDALDAPRAQAWVERFLAAAEAEREALGELDRLSGDGDYGANLAVAIGHIYAVLERAPASVGDPFDGASTGFLRTGGTSGPLFGMWFRAFAQAGADRAAIDLDELAAAAEEGLAAVRRLGGAEVGDKTMVDALAPAVGALLAGAEDGAELEAALSAAAVAARAGAEATADLVARRGRASYVGEVARGVIDPGAVTAALFFEAAVEAPPVTH